MTSHPTWLVPIDDGSAPIAITIRSERVVPPCVHVDIIEPGRLLKPLEAAQLSLALAEASKYAAQIGTKKAVRR